MTCAAEWRTTRRAAGSFSLRSSRATSSWSGRGEVDDALGGRWRGRSTWPLRMASRAALVGVGGDGGERADAGDDDGGGEARGDAVGDVEGRGAGGDFADGAVGSELDLDWIAHAYKDSACEREGSVGFRYNGRGPRQLVRGRSEPRQ